MNEPAPTEDEDRIARALEQVHDDLIDGKPSDSSVSPDAAEPNLLAAADVIELLERVRDIAPSATSKSASPEQQLRETPTDFSTPGGPSNGESLGPGSRDTPQAVGRFQIKRQLGRGGHGLVFLAYDPQLERDVALKIPRLEAFLNEEMRSRFMLEARAAAGLNHPHIVPVYDAGESGPIHFIATRFVDGISLARWLSERPHRVGDQAAARLVATLADAISHAHSRGIVHRDIKPSNVMLDCNGNSSGIDESSVSNVATITDFGLAKFLDGNTLETRDEAIVGTPAYMAPEQTGNKHAVGPWTDIYGLGAVLYETLTGQPPFQRDSVLETIRAVEDEEPTRPRRLAHSIPKDLEAVCLKCLEKSPSERYSSARELQLELQRFLDGRQVTARPVTSWNRFAKFARRNRTTVGLASLLLVTLVAATIISTRFGIQANRQTVVAEREAERSRKAIFRLFSAITEHPEFKAQGMESVRKSLLGEAMSLYGDLVREAPDDVVATTGRNESIYLLAKINSELGNRKQAVDYLLQIIQPADASTSPSRQLRLASYEVELASILYSLGDSSRGDEYFDQAIPRLRRLVQHRKVATEATRGLAEALTIKAHAASTRGQTGRILPLVAEAIGCWEKLRHSSQSDNEREGQLAECLLLQAKCEQQSGDLTAALESVTAANSAFEKLSDTEKLSVIFKERLASGLQLAGVIHSHQSQFETAAVFYEKSEKQLRKLAADHPAVPAYQGRAAGLTYSRGFLKYSTGNYEQAVEILSENVDRTKALASRYPELRNQFLQSCATNQQLLFGAYEELGQTAKAREALQSSIDSYQSILADVPDNNFVATHLANGFVLLGNSHFKAGEYEASLAAANKAIGRLELVLKESRDDVDASRYLAAAYECKVANFTKLGDWQQALTSTELLDKHAQSADQRLLASTYRLRSLIEMGHFNEAAENIKSFSGKCENATTSARKASAEQLEETMAAAKHAKVATTISQPLIDTLEVLAGEIGQPTVENEKPSQHP